MLPGAAAFVLVFIGFFMGVHSAAIASRPPHKRPRYAQGRFFRLLWPVCRYTLVLAGLITAAAVSRPYAAVLLGALLTAWARRRYVRSAIYTKKMLRAAFVDLCKKDPATPREELLAFLIQSRHPRWDPEMIAQMVGDHPTVDGLLDSLVRLERKVIE
jgi:hypothetical protein